MNNKYGKKGWKGECQWVATGKVPTRVAGGDKYTNGQSDRDGTWEMEGEGEGGYLLVYTPTREDLRI